MNKLEALAREYEELSRVMGLKAICLRNRNKSLIDSEAFKTEWTALDSREREASAKIDAILKVTT